MDEPPANVAPDERLPRPGPGDVGIRRGDCQRPDRLHILVASLEDVIRSKEVAGREKNRLALPRLRRLLDQRRRAGRTFAQYAVAAGTAFEIDPRSRCILGLAEDRPLGRHSLPRLLRRYR